MDWLSKITIGEYQDKLQKQIKEREDRIEEIKLLAIYLPKEISGYINLLQLENAVTRAKISCSGTMVRVLVVINLANPRTTL